MDIYLQGLLWVLGIGIVTGGLTALFHRWTAGEGRVLNNEVVGGVFTIVGGLHAVLVAFVLISLFDGASGAHDNAQQEANALVAASWAADSLPDPARTKIHELAHEYAMTVRDKEWPQMRSGQLVVGPGEQQLAQLHTEIAGAANTDDDWVKDRKTEASNELWQVYQSRQQRLDAAGGGVNAVVWFALIIGGVLSIAVAFLFAGARGAGHIVVMGILAATITLVLFAIFQMQDPFTGGANVGPDAFDSALARLG